MNSATTSLAARSTSTSVYAPSNGMPPPACQRSVRFASTASGGSSSIGRPVPGTGTPRNDSRASCPVGGVVGLERALLGLFPRPVPVGHREAGRPLEHVQVRGDRRDLGRDLDPGRPGPDQPDPLAGEVDAVGGPPCRVVPGPLERVEPRQVRHLVLRQAAHRGHEEPRRDRRTVVGGHRPARRRRRPTTPPSPACSAGCAATARTCPPRGCRYRSTSGCAGYRSDQDHSCSSSGEKEYE